MKPLPATPSVLRMLSFWKFQLMFWGFAVLAQLLLIALMGRASSEVIDPLLICFRFGLLITLSTVAARALEWLDGRKLSQMRFTVSVGMVILLLFVIANAVGYGFYTLQLHRKPPAEILLSFLLLRLVLYTLWTTLFLRLLGKIHREKLDHKSRMAELTLLRAQVNPHFLFNSLNAVVAESENPAKVREITTALSEYLRFSVRQSHDGGVELRPLGEELKALEDYLRIHQIRFEEKLVTKIDAEVEALSQRVPQALIQPLLENAISYGQQTSPNPLVISITAQVSGEDLVVVVENSGSWIEASSRSESTGTGLQNLQRRLELIYGAKASLVVEKPVAKVRVRVTLPVDQQPRA